MQIKYEELDYQTDAVDAVLGLLDSSEKILQDSRFALVTEFGIVPNRLSIEDELLRNKVKEIQQKNAISKDSIAENVSLKDFSIEMETGTGKTFVYLKTIFELHQKHSLLKFIIIVPSIAIREGVLATLQSTREYFHKKYKTYANFVAYEGDSKQKISKLKAFAEATGMSILVMSIQAFNSDSNIINEERRDDSKKGDKMMTIIAKTNPILILDEPQNMESELSKSAISKLNPLLKLRYSATHKNFYNLLYSLSPFEAYNKGLVKKIEIASVVVDDPNAVVFEPQKILLKKGGNSQEVRAKVEVKTTSGEYEYKTRNFRLSEFIKLKTGNNQKYEDLRITNIYFNRQEVETSDGKLYSIGVTQTENKADIFKIQIRETIKNHLSKQDKLGNRIKVLSLFFIDKVKNYTDDDGSIKCIFEEEFEKLKNSSVFFKNKKAAQVHNGYFSKSGRNFKDTKGNSVSDKATYDLIMKDKKKLLSFAEEVCFIFSHSALREGWDNPNVFTICTLNETTSPMKKRQEIGRGMRLCLDKNGNRIKDLYINKLVVVPNESYKDYVATLQTEFIESGQEPIKPPPQDDRKEVKFKKEFALEDENFQTLWGKIKQKTKYNIKLDTKKFIPKISAKINGNLSVRDITIKVEKQAISMKDNKIQAVHLGDSEGTILKKNYPILDLVGEIERETLLTRQTILAILEKIDMLDYIFQNPRYFIRNVIAIFKKTLEEELFDGIQYSKIDNDYWQMELFEDIETYGSKTIKTRKSVYDYTIFDGNGEKEFAQNLDESDSVKVFTKLPRKFIVDTPIGTYNPDWAIVWQDGDKAKKLYLVRETKFVDNLENLRPSEEHKIKCAKKHFAEIEVDFKTSKDKTLNDLISSKGY